MRITFAWLLLAMMPAAISLAATNRADTTESPLPRFEDATFLDLSYTLVASRPVTTYTFALWHQKWKQVFPTVEELKTYIATLPKGSRIIINDALSSGAKPNLKAMGVIEVCREREIRIDRAFPR